MARALGGPAVAWADLRDPCRARVLGLRCRLPDHPGSLAALLGDIAELGANVLEVSHERLVPTLRVDEVEVVLQIETRGPEHCEDVKVKLRARGYTLAFS